MSQWLGGPERKDGRKKNWALRGQTIFRIPAAPRPSRIPGGRAKRPRFGKDPDFDAFLPGTAQGCAAPAENSVKSSLSVGEKTEPPFFLPPRGVFFRFTRGPCIFRGGMGFEPGGRDPRKRGEPFFCVRFVLRSAPRPAKDGLILSPVARLAHSGTGRASHPPTEPPGGPFYGFHHVWKRGGPNSGFQLNLFD